MTKLGVNIDHIATVREARKIDEPDPVTAAAIAELAGAHGITVHLRGDRRHIKERDIEILRRTVKTRLNIEMAVTEEMVKIATSLRPYMATFVPEREDEVTTEGGLDVILNQEPLRKYIRILRDSDIKVSIFADPDIDQLKAAGKVDAQAVEINTAKYSEALTEEAREREAKKIEEAAKIASRLKLAVLAGHGLNTRNVGRISAIPEIEELNIGHSIVANATLVGLERAVTDILEAMGE